MEVSRTMLPKTVLQAQQVRKSFGGRGNVQQVLKGIDLRISSGEFVGIMGPSGSGKSTLIQVLATIDQATAGEIRIDDTDVTKMSDAELSRFRRSRLGFIFEDYRLLDTLTVKENIMLPISLGKMNKERAEEAFLALASDLGILDIVHQYPHEISGGQRQRTSAARALIHHPSIVFADEPTGALDSKSAAALLDVLEDMNRRRSVTMLLVTHDPVVSSYCSRVVFLKDGMLYSEVYRGSKTRQTFFQDIINVQAVLGGNRVDTF